MQAKYSRLYLTTHSLQYRKEKKQGLRVTLVRNVVWFTTLYRAKGEQATTVLSEHICHHQPDLSRVPQNFLLTKKPHILYSLFSKREDLVELSQTKSCFKNK